MTVLRAAGGREAIAVAQQELPDLIVLDLMMPEVNGFDVVEALSASADTARIPILDRHRQADHREDRDQAEWLRDGDHGESGFTKGRFAAEVRRAMSGRRVGA